MIDFGLSKRYKDAKTGEHIPYRDNKSLTGTARYASVNTHIGIEQARRDDMESLVYILLYFLKGQLPWQGLAGKNKNDKYDRIKEKKIQTTVEQLCRGQPEEFSKYLNYCKNLTFEERPDYNYLRGLWRQLMVKNGWESDGQFDWILKKEGNTQELRSLQEEKKAPIPGRVVGQAAAGGSAGLVNARSSSKNFLENNEERKEMRANMGAQIMTNNRNTARV